MQMGITSQEIFNSISQEIVNLPFPTSPAPLYQPMSYLLGHTGKRVRPVLAVLAYQACEGKEQDKMISASLALEMVHNFTLMHDDIMDQAPVRRGQPTVHIKWDVNTAILSGDALFALAYPQLITPFPEVAAQMVRFFTDVVVGVCEGQMEDMVKAQEPHVSIPEYIEMIRKKTAVLIGGALGLGAIAAQAKQPFVDALYQIGELMGTGFQLQDDLLDVYGDQTKFGKQPGGDIIENKKTYLLLRALEKSGRYQKENLLNWLQYQEDNSEKVKQITSIYDELNIKSETSELIDNYYSRAQEKLNSLSDKLSITELQVYMNHVFLREK